MPEEEKREERTREAEVEPEPAEKPAWVKPIIRARGSFDQQALACARPRFGPPFCLGGVS